MRNQITFEAGLVNKGELRQGASGNDYLFFTVARNYSEKQPDDTYKELGTIYVNCVAYGAQARSLEASEIGKGMTLFITGTLKGNIKKAYIDKSGVEHPETFEEQVIVESLGVSLSRNQRVDASRITSGGTTAPKSESKSMSKTLKTEEFMEEVTKTASEVDTDDDFDDIFR